MTFFADTAIDAVQDAKTSFLKTFVKDESLSKPLHTLVEAQRSFAKQAAKAAFDVGTAFFDASQKLAYPGTAKTK